MTPKIVMLRRENRMPTELLVDESRETFEPLNVGENTHNLRTTLIKSHETARKHLQNAFRTSTISRVQCGEFSLAMLFKSWMKPEKLGSVENCNPCIRDQLLSLRK